MIALVVMAALLCVGGAGLAIVGVRFRRSIAGFNARAIAIQGTVVGSRMQWVNTTSTPRQVYFPQISFSTAEGRSIVVDGIGEPEPPAAGAPRPLLYDPADPREVSFTGPRGQARIPETLIVLGGTLGVSGIALMGLALALG